MIEQSCNNCKYGDGEFCKNDKFRELTVEEINEYESRCRYWEVKNE